jgi:excisionase family DNA binding protein
MSLEELRRSKKAVITRTEAADLLGCDVRTVSRGIASNTIPSLKLGRRIFIPVQAFLTILGFEA